jgi:hypothetical protein
MHSLRARLLNLVDQELHQLLEKVDADLAQEPCQKGCLYCRGKLHRADYDRKPRGGPQWQRRYSVLTSLCGITSPRTVLPARSIFVDIKVSIRDYQLVWIGFRHHGDRTISLHAREAYFNMFFWASRKAIAGVAPPSVAISNAAFIELQNFPI